MSRSKSGMGGGKSKSKSSAHEMHIKRAHGGGFIVTHHPKKKHPMDDSEPEQHVVPDADALANHVQQNMGDQPAAGEGPAEPEQAQAAPAPAPMPTQGM